MTEYALRLQNGTDTAPRLRLADTLGLAVDGALGARGGLRPDGGGAVTVVAGTMQVQVSPFLAWIDGTASVTQAGYVFVCDATKVLTLDPGDSAQVRVDTVAARVRENAFDSSGSTAADVFVVKGTPGAGAPVVPVGCEALRDINVPANAAAGTGGLTAGALGADRRRFTTALGGILQVSGQTQRDAAGVEGRVVYRKDTKALELYDGGAWRTIPTGGSASPQAGKVSITTGSSGSTTSAAIVFATPYASVPSVNVTVESTSPGTNTATVSGITTTGCTIRLTRSGASATIPVHWQAIPRTQPDQ